MHKRQPNWQLLFEKKLKESGLTEGASQLCQAVLQSSWRISFRVWLVFFPFMVTRMYFFRSIVNPCFICSFFFFCDVHVNTTLHVTENSSSTWRVSNFSNLVYFRSAIVIGTQRCAQLHSWKAHSMQIMFWTIRVQFFSVANFKKSV